MSKRNIIVELAHSERLEAFAASATAGEETTLDGRIAPRLDTFTYDKSFPSVPVPQLARRERPAGDIYDTTSELVFSMAPETSTYLVRGTVEEDALAEFEKEIGRKTSVKGFYADATILPTIVCPGSPPVGTDATVETLLCTNKMRDNDMDGKGVLVAIVDSGVNLSYLNNQGKTPVFDAARSWSWDPATVTPGQAPVGHGTMCAFDVCIAAPECTLLDIALLHPISAAPGGSIIEGLLSDAIRAYRHLLDLMDAPRRPGESRSLVVNNSWGMFHPSWDFPVGHAGNYSDNPNHPFSRIVATLERAGADILFAAGNCGADCPDGRCQGVTDRPIYGANSSASVLCVAGVDTTKDRVGYSSSGPGRLENRKPDISSFTHFKGSGVYTADGGTSAACPVVSGAVAAIRSKRPYNADDPKTSPAAIRNLITSTAEDQGPTGYDYHYGYGVLDTCKIVDKLTETKPPAIDICQRYPWLCDLDWWWRFLRRYDLPDPILEPADPMSEDPSAVPMASEDLETMFETLVPQADADEEEPSPERLAYEMGYWMGYQDGEDDALDEEFEDDF